MTLRFVRSFEVPGEFLEPHPATLHSVLCHPLIYCAIEFSVHAGLTLNECSNSIPLIFMQHVSVSLSGFLKVNVMLTFKIKFSVNGKASFLDPLMFTKRKKLAK